MGKIDKFMEQLETLGDGRYHYWDGSVNGIGCSDYVKLALIRAGILNSGEYFHAASGVPGPLVDGTRFRKIAWSRDNLQRGDIMWSHGHHVAVWDGNNGVYEAAPENTHGICANGKTGVGHWPSHTHYNCGTGTDTWSWLYRIIDTDESTETAKEAVQVDKSKNLETLAGFLPEIKYGSYGWAVMGLQAILKKYGWYTDALDGQAGPNTVKGIKLMQTALGLDPDGIVNKKTWTKLLT